MSSELDHTSAEAIVPASEFEEFTRFIRDKGLSPDTSDGLFSGEVITAKQFTSRETDPTDSGLMIAYNTLKILQDHKGKFKERELRTLKAQSDLLQKQHSLRAKERRSRGRVVRGSWRFSAERSEC